MIYLLDTVTVVRHFTGTGKIGKKAQNIFNSFNISNDEFIISVISLMEILYLSEKNRINIDLEKTVSIITKAEGYRIIDLNIEIIKTASKIKFNELHDRILIATAKWLDVPIITSDIQISKFDGIDVIW